MASLSSSELGAVCEKFSTAQNLTDVESRNDPENDPFRSRYKARELFREIYCSLKSFEPVDGEESVEQLRDLSGDSPDGLRAVRMAAVDYYLGVNHIDTEELSAGEEHLINCLKLLDKCRVSPENVSLFIHVRNQLGILWAGREEMEKAQGFLEMAESIYQQYMKEEGSPPLDITEYFCTEENLLTHQEKTKRFELAYTYTMYYLAQVYQNLGQTERAATYCHSTLQRQLQLNQYNPMEWALNAATLSQYYISKDCYMEGRHCLSAAVVISSLAWEVSSEAAAQESEIESEHRDKLKQKRAEIARCWIKYCLNLLEDAKKLLQDGIGQLDVDRQEELKRARRHEEEEMEKGRKGALLFGSEDTFDSIASMEEKVPCLLPLAFFEDDLERRCKMHKRQVDMLEPICNDLNSQYYLLIRRQLMFELAEIYYEMMDLKLTLANIQTDAQALDNHTIKKVNHLGFASAKYFQMFLDSLCSLEGKFPEHLEEEVLRPALVARFRVARLHSRLICSSPSAKLDNLNKSLENYQYVVHYCEAHPEAAKSVETELELSKDMVGLLPLNINSIKARMATNN
ncbi:KIF-binding protein isoform X1 [Thalassophryne amazonica]|uniref:KIF-binding protein isoform X1 n=1 Tax=Thalassophryne amazonica TaxID=390379 RepID=UPI0014710489|nr:KIF-binding protein isoform X1 [Thalassophryne amazonica]